MTYAESFPLPAILLLLLLLLFPEKQSNCKEPLYPSLYFKATVGHE